MRNECARQSSVYTVHGDITWRCTYITHSRHAAEIRALNRTGWVLPAEFASSRLQNVSCILNVHMAL